MAKKQSRDAYYFAFGAKDWRSSESVRLMSLTEQGCFINLLAIAWLSSDEPCSIPAGDEEIAALLGIPVDEWKRHAPRVLAEFDETTKSGRLRNTRLWSQYREMKESHKRRVRGGRLTANKRWGSPLQDGDSSAIAQQHQSDSSAVASQSHSQSQLTTPARTPKRAASEGPKYPHFPKSHCDELHAVWSRFGVVEYPVFRRMLGPVFEGPNAKPFEDVKVAMVEAIARAEKETRGEFLTLPGFVRRVGYWIGEAKGRPVGVDPATGILRPVA